MIDEEMALVFCVTLEPNPLHGVECNLLWGKDIFYIYISYEQRDFCNETLHAIPTEYFFMKFI